MEPLGLDVFFLAPVAVRNRGPIPCRDCGAGRICLSMRTIPLPTRTPSRISPHTRQMLTRAIHSPWFEIPRPPIILLAWLSCTCSYPMAELTAALLELAKRSRRRGVQSIGGPRASKLSEDKIRRTRWNCRAIACLTRWHIFFERKKGHCEYFASSMTVMLRTLGFPLAWSTGFRGGEYNDLTGNYIIRQKDAHSWVEAYFPEYGWVSFDPTSGRRGHSTRTTRGPHGAVPGRGQ